MVVSNIHSADLKTPGPNSAISKKPDLRCFLNSFQVVLPSSSDKLPILRFIFIAESGSTSAI